ncbi:MAG: DUF2975 domain-containing protein [Pelagimonas sp.]|uniref:DUF2975 domain-containing protein n=1 Tax=Pelagimonas sp. TaxID=2073170 RepID=UPI003D6C2C77
MTNLPERTRTAAFILRIATLAGTALVAGATLWAVYRHQDLAQYRVADLAIPASDWDIGRLATALLQASAMAEGLVILAVLWFTASLLKQYQNNTALSEQAARAIRNIGFGTLALAAVQILRQPLDTFALTLDAPEGQRMISLGFGTGELGTVIGGGIMLLIGAVMMQAVSISQENQEFV